MITRKAYKFSIKANSEIEALLFQFFRCNRKVWNMALALQKNSLERNRFQKEETLVCIGSDRTGYPGAGKTGFQSICRYRWYRYGRGPVPDQFNR